VRKPAQQYQQPEGTKGSKVQEEDTLDWKHIQITPPPKKEAK
jgi:superfamily II DNA or RNA helicase